MRTARRMTFVSACLALMGLGCSDGTALVPDAGPGARTTLSIAGKTLECDVAADATTRQTAAMFREPEDLPDGSGILYVYDRVEKQGPSMNSVKIPLTIAFLDEKGEILQIEDMKPHDARRTVSKKRIRFAVQVNRGWFRKNGIGVGASFDDFEKMVEDVTRR